MIIVDTEKYKDENQNHPKCHHPYIRTGNILTYIELYFANSVIVLLFIKRR